MSQINKNNVVLELPSMTAFDSYIEALKEGYYPGVQTVKTPEEIAEIKKRNAEFVASLNEEKTGYFATPSGDKFPYVPYECLWLMYDDIFIGEISFRHELNEMLANFGGHVGYGIRPSLSRQGFGTLALKLTKERAKNMGMTQLLLTCSPKNIASVKIIERNKGEYIDTVENSYGYNDLCNRYNISL